MQPAAWKKNRAALSRFFVIDGGEWHHSRIDDELAKAAAFIEKQKANGARGGRPKKAKYEKPEESQTESQNKPTGFDRDNPNHNPNESPSPSPTPKTKPLAAATPLTVVAPPEKSVAAAPEKSKGPDPITARAIELAVLLRPRGAAIQASDPRLRAWAAQGVTDAQVLSALETATARRAEQGSPQPVNSGYLDAIITDLLAEKPAKRSEEKAPPWWSSNDLMIAKGATLGMSPRPGEDWPQFRGRINAKLADAANAA
jgi:hypothetical protein